jgi:MFS family permease
MLWGGMLANRLGAMVVPFLALYLTRARGLSVVTVGVVMVGFGAGSLLSYLLGGWLADLIGRRATLIIGMLASAAVLIGLGYVRGFTAVVVMVFALGLTVDMYRPAAAAVVADIVPPQRRAWAYSQLYWAVNLGFSVAMVTGGVLARAGFTWLIWADAVTSVAFAVLVWRAVPDTRSRTDPAQRRTGLAGSYLAVFNDRVMLGFTLISLSYALVFIQGTTTLPLVMSSHGLSATSYGLAIAVNGVTIIVAQPLIARWVGPLDHGHVAAVGMTLLGAGFGVAALAHATWQYAMSVFIWTLGEATVMAVAQAIVAQLAPVQLRGRYNGVYGATWSAALLVGPLAGTWLIHGYGSTALWLACLATGLAGALAQLALAPAVRRRGAGLAGDASGPD